MTEKFLRAIIIDPEYQTINVIRLRDDKTLLDEVHKLIGAKTLDHFIIADHEESFDQGWVDDGGLARGEPIHAFLFYGNKSPVAGRCVLIGIDKETKDTCDAQMPLDFLHRAVTWLGVILPEVTTDTVQLDGKTIRETNIVTYSRVKR